MSKQYIEPEKRYENERSTGIMFSLFGAIGVSFMVLCRLKIISFPLSLFQIAVLSFVFLAFFFLGILSLKKASKLAETIDAENAEVAAIRSWILNNQHSFCSESEETDTDLFFQREQEIREHILAQYPDLSEELLELLTEETYNHLFE